MAKKFVKNNEGFICKNCKAEVPKHPSSSRDHCTECLFSMHVDINPGDRLNNCKGLLEPVGIKINSDKEKLIYKCRKCNSIVQCIVAPDDSREKIIELSTRTY